MSTGQGFLGIFNDVPAAAETDYLHWLTREHTQERLSVPGFLRVRVFRTEKEEVKRTWRASMRRPNGRAASCRY